MFEELKECLTARNSFAAEENAYFQAAVVVPILMGEAGPEILFEIRAGHLAWQPGEICFPGGKIEAQDKNPQTAAVRECREELGLKEEQIRLIGELAPVISPIGVILYPQVGVIEGSIFPNPDEVAKVFSVPLDYLLKCKPKVAQMEMATRPAKNFPLELLPGYEKEWKRRKNYDVYFYSWKDNLIWGLTALVLRRFLQVWEIAANGKAGL